MQNSNSRYISLNGKIKLRRKLPLNDSEFSKLSKYCWPFNYLGYLDDSNSALRFLHFYNSQKEFFKNNKISDTLIEKTCDWPFNKFVGSFVYHYVTSRLNINNNLLTYFDWQNIITFSLIPSCYQKIIDIWERNSLDEFSKKTSLIDGATQSLSIYSNFFDYENKLFVEQILTSVLHFLNVPKKDIKILIDSTLSDKNTKKLGKFLQNYT